METKSIWYNAEDVKTYNKTIRAEINKMSTILKLDLIDNKPNSNNWIGMSNENLDLNRKYRSVLRNYKEYELKKQKDIDDAEKEWIDKKVRIKSEFLKKYKRGGNMASKPLIATNGSINKVFKSQKECAKYFGISNQRVKLILERKKNNLAGWKFTRDIK